MVGSWLGVLAGAGCAVAMIGGAPLPAAAQPWPQRQVKFITPLPPGTAGRGTKMSHHD